ncbi:MAG TPA: alanine racemase [Planctomycetota bacterium]
MLRIPIEADFAAGAPAWIEVDLEAVAHNVQQFRAMLRSGCQLIAVVKANAYGHGMVRIARTVLASGADQLAVANVAEGAALRENGITAPILIAGPVLPSQAPSVVQHGLLPSLGTIELAHAMAAACRRFPPVHIEVDTGMARHGVPAALLGEFVAAVQRRGRLSIAGVFTHLAATNPAAKDSMERQLGAFTAAVGAVRELRGVNRHVCNTLGSLVLPSAHLDAVRIGGGLYGFDPLGGRGPVRLRPALALKARLAALRAAAAGEAVGYGSTFVCHRPSRLALVPLGYADGLVREVWRGAEVLVRGQRVPIVGQISMNQTVVDVTDVPDVAGGDEVVLLGAQRVEVVRAEERVGPGGSVYEVTSLLRRDLPRRFLPLHQVAAGRGTAVVEPLPLRP